MKPQKAKPFKMPKARYHKALFDSELPFQPKVEKRKDNYQRKPKHPNRYNETDE